MDKKVLVTGGAGFIGSHLCERLAQKGCGVRALVRYNSKNNWGWLEDSRCKEKIEVFAGDIRNQDNLKSAMRGIDTVFHLAALIGIPYSYSSPEAYIDTNITGTLNLLQAARDAGVKKFVHTSTSEVYGSAQYVPINESHPINPQSPYAATKAGADFLALSFQRSFGLPVAIVRPFNTFGPRQSARAIIPTIIIQILNGKNKIRLGSTAPTRDFTFVKDTAEGFIKAAECAGSVGEIINIGSNFEVSVGELAKLIAKLIGAEIKIQSDEERKRPGSSEVERLCADTKKAKGLLGWSKTYSLEEGLKETIKWFRAHKDLYKADIYNV
jgi:dTDP-glucose 4,6-dehydratase